MKIEIPIENRKHKGLTAIVDSKDLHLVANYKWRVAKRKSWKLTKTFVAYATVNKRKIYMHLLIMQKKYGYAVRHQDCNCLNNSKENLVYVEKEWARKRPVLFSQFLNAVAV
jgi:hypothetical protein